MATWVTSFRSKPARPSLLRMTVRIVIADAVVMALLELSPEPSGTVPQTRMDKTAGTLGFDVWMRALRCARIPCGA